MLPWYQGSERGVAGAIRIRSQFMTHRAIGRVPPAVEVGLARQPGSPRDDVARYVSLTITLMMSLTIAGEAHPISETPRSIRVDVVHWTTFVTIKKR